MVAPQPFEAFVGSLLGSLVALAFVPDLGLQEDVGPVANTFADAAFVLVDGRGVDQPVADIERGLDRFGCIVLVDLVGAEAELRDLAVVIQRKRGVIGHEISFAHTMVQTAHVSGNSPCPVP